MSNLIIMAISSSSSSMQFYFAITKRLILILLLLSLSRMCLYTFNMALFNGFDFVDIIHAWWVGLRFDLSFLSMIAAVYLLANHLPFQFASNRYFQKIIDIFTLTLVSVAIAINITDAIYYRFTLKRMTFDIFSYIKSTDAFWDVAPTFLYDFWWTVLVGIVIIAFLIKLYFRIKPTFGSDFNVGWKNRVKSAIGFFVVAGLLVIGIRGGLQLKPIGIVDASLKAPAALNPVVLNTPFVMVKSYGYTGLQVKNDFSESELKTIFDPSKSYKPLHQKDFSAKNVVIIILESFSMEHMGYFTGKQTFTPFLDSLLSKSLTHKCVANGKRSIEGIPAILSGLPTLSDESFLNSSYAANSIEGIAGTLRKYNYHTSFFHGGKNGTMSFDSYAASAGFDHYFGLNEYKHDGDYDGHWGIWDEPYLQYFSQQLEGFPQPFMTTVFTLSSHHPYKVPEEYLNQFPKGALEIQQTIAYTDHALSKFFETASKTSWFKNTLFVITADHTSEGGTPFYQNSLGQFCIPLAFYAQNDSLLTNKETDFPVQQTDIYPSVIQYLGITDTIISFGESVFDTARTPFAVNFFNQKMQILNNELLLQLSGDEPMALYHYRTDSLLAQNLINSQDFSSLLRFQKAFRQQFNNRMIKNQLTHRP